MKKPIFVVGVIVLILMYFIGYAKVWVKIDSVPARVQDPGKIVRFLPWTDVRVFGVKGNGTKDDTDALQAAFDYVASNDCKLLIPQNFSIRTTKNLYIYGRCEIVGSGWTSKIILDADLADADGDTYWINFGIPKKGGVPTTFSGAASNLQFYLTPNARVRRMLFFHNARKFTVRNCFFDAREMPKGLGKGATAIEGGNDVKWCSAPMREIGRILNNTFLADQDTRGGEGFGMAAASDIVFDNNYIRGVGDDPIGCHSITTLTITNNHCYSLDGRILFNNCSNVRVIGNYCERIADVSGTYYGHGALMMAQIESKTKPATTDIIISDNHLLLPPDLPNHVYGIRLRGVRNAIITNNIVRMESPNGGGNIIIEADTHKEDWTDPTGIDPDGIARPRNIMISNNYCCGTHAGSILQVGSTTNLPGPFFIEGNVAGGFKWYSANCSFTENNKIIDNDPTKYLVHGEVIPNLDTLFEVDAENIAPASVVTGLRLGGVITRYYANHNGKILGIRIVLDTSITDVADSYIGVYCLINGVKKDHRIMLPIHGRGANLFWPYNQTNTCFKADDYIEIKIAGSADLEPSSINAVVQVMGVLLK